MKLLLAISMFVLVAYAQIPQPCESPLQWEGRVLTSDRSKKFASYGRLSYDETQRRIRIIEELQQGSMEDFYDVLYLHNVGKEYRLNLKTKQCNVTNLMRPFRPFGIPREAQFDGSETIGLSGVAGEYMVVNAFHGNFSNGDHFFGAVTSPDCIPVQSGFDSNETGFVHRSFFDVNIGISDPMVFIPPRECL